MPKHLWSISRDAAATSISALGVAEADALLSWAIWSVDTLWYAIDLDAQQNSTQPLGHDRHVVDIAHVRSASAAAVTALDQCAAVLARVHLAHAGPRESSVAELDPAGNKSAQARFAGLRSGAQVWIRNVVADPAYALIKEIRNPMTHAWKHRVLFEETSFGPRTGFRTQSKGSIAAPEVVRLSAEVATRHVELFVAGVCSGGVL